MSVFAIEKGRKTLKKQGFYAYARNLHLSIDLLVFLGETCNFMRSEQKIKGAARVETEVP